MPLRRRGGGGEEEGRRRGRRGGGGGEGEGEGQEADSLASPRRRFSRRRGDARLPVQLYGANLAVPCGGLGDQTDTIPECR